MRFVAKRLLLFIAALVGLSILVFLALRVLPGDVAAVMAGTNATAARIAALRTQMGLDGLLTRRSLEEQTITEAIQKKLF